MTFPRLILAGAVSALIVFSCGPFFSQAVFTPKSYPRFPEGEYVSGKIGIVWPNYWRKFLVVAWRSFEGKPLTAVEQKAFLGGDSPREGFTSTIWKEVQVDRDVPGGTYQSFVNCGEDAFRRAEAKYAELTKQFGEKHAGVAAWKKAQDVVFANCAGGEQTPGAPEAGLPAALVKERKYQIAAAHFYAMRYEMAEREFREIGEPYLAARCLIRQGTVGALDRAALEQAERELRKVGDSPLLGFVRAKLRPEEHRREMAKRLNDPKLEATFAQSLTDYTWMLDRENATFTGDEMTEWIAAVQAGSGEPARRWRASKKVSWLVAALMHAQPTDEGLAELLEAARAVGPASPAYASARYHRVRLLLAAKDEATARKELDETLARKELPLSAVNAFKAQRLETAQGYAEWVAFAPRVPVATEFEGEAMGEAAEKPEPLFDSDAAVQANRGLPLSLLQKAAADAKLPAGMRAQLENAAKTRRIVLTGGTYDEIYSVLKTPAMQPYVTDGLDRRPDDPAEIDNYRDNWWCAWGERETPAIPEWLTAAAKAEAQKELAALRAMPPAATWLARRAVELAQATPGEARNGELLHLAVRATRYGCGLDDSTSAASRAAFRLLHKMYPKSEWARKTPYYF